MNHFLDRMGLPALLERYLPSDDPRLLLPPASAVRLLAVNLLLGRSPLYALGEWAGVFDPALLAMSAEDVAALNDDRAGRALERLFDADRSSLLTELMLAVISEFAVDTSELHNDSTSISVHGVYPNADGAPRGGKHTPVITWGHSKDRRPDLKQLVWILTVAADGSVPIAYRLADGNTNDDPHPRPDLGRPRDAAGPHRLPLFGPVQRYAQCRSVGTCEPLRGLGLRFASPTRSCT